jgi:hypothetical protein
MPVNIGFPPDITADEHVIPHYLYHNSLQLQGIGQAINALPANRGGGFSPSDDLGGDEGQDLIHQVGGKEGSQESPSTLNYEACDLSLSQGV